MKNSSQKPIYKDPFYFFFTIYLTMIFISLSLFARDSEWCFKARWPENSFNSNVAMIGVFLPAIVWPIYLPGTLIARDSNEGHLCNFGGK